MMSYNKKDIEALALLRPVESNNNHIDVDRHVYEAHVLRSEYISGQISNLFASIANKYKTYRRNQLAKQSLYAMTDRELADLGISRAEIDYVVDGKTQPEASEQGSFLAKLFRSISAKIAAAQKARAGYAQLMAMDARQLADIGLTRGDIEAAVNDGLPKKANDNLSAANNNGAERHAI